MQLSCSSCGQIFKSVVIAKDAAMTEILEKLVKHVMTEHKEQFVLLHQKSAEVLMLANGRLVMNMLTNVLTAIDESDERQMFLLENYVKNEEQIRELLDIEDESEEGEEEAEVKVKTGE